MALNEPTRGAMMTALQVEPVGPRAEEGNQGGPFLVRHALRDHPLLTLDALAECASELRSITSKGQRREDRPVEHHRGDLPEVLPAGQPPRVEGLDVAEMVRTVETNGCWMVLWNVEQLPRYAELLDACLADVEPLATPGKREVLREGFIFISAPNSVTPVHIDPEHNVLLQISGDKTLAVGRLRDEELWRHEIERTLLGGDRHLPVGADDERAFHLSDGLGVYVPPFAPHWVRNGPTTCISLSVTWRTADAYHTELVHVANGWLRRMGVSPRPPGASRSADSVKVWLIRLGRPVKLTVQRLLERASRRS